MQIKRPLALLSATIAITGLTATGAAFGQAALTGPGTVINQPPTGSSSCTTTSTAPCAENYQFAPGTGTTNTTVTASPTTYTFDDTFNQTKGVATVSDFGSSVYKCPGGPNCLTSNPLLTWNFQDNYDFTTQSSGPQVQGAVLSFSIPGYGVGLENVQARIVAYASNQQGAAQLVSASIPAVVDGWKTVTTAGGVNLYTATLNSTTLAPGTEYVLQVRGEALTAGSYNGSVTFTPVPIPAGIVLLLSGIAGVMALVRYRPGTPMTFAFPRGAT
jgi:hypothetical protein